MSRLLNDLDPVFRPFAVEFLARCVEAQIPVLIVDTLRTPAEQADNIARGVSWTKNSLHLVGRAIDVCPYELYTLAAGGDKLQWDTTDPVWLKLGRIGEACGMEWGGRWLRTPDMGHFQYKAPAAPRGPTA